MKEFSSKLHSSFSMHSVKYANADWIFFPPSQHVKSLDLNKISDD